MIKFRGLFKKMWRYGCLLLFSKKTFIPPPQSEVLIYDAGGSKHLIRNLNLGKAEILHVRGEKLNLAVLLKALFKKGRLRDSYEDCYISFVNPSVVITYIDNSTQFYLLSKRNPKVKTIFVQNGVRGGIFDVFHETLNHLAVQANVYNVDIMCTYGDAIGREYSKHISGKYIAIGSLFNNEYQISVGNKKIRRIAYISMTDGKENFFSQETEFVLRELMRYSNDRRVPLVIVGRSGHASEELYYRELLGSVPVFLRRNEQHSSYKYLDETEVSVSIDSSLGYETVARGNKNAFFSILGHFHKSNGHNFGWPASYPDDGPFWTNRPDPGAFDRILDYLFEINEVKWRKQLEATNYSSLITYNSGNSLVKSILEKELGSMLSP